MSVVNFRKLEPELIVQIKKQHQELQKISEALSGVSSMAWNAGVESGSIAGLISYISDDLFDVISEMDGVVSNL